MANIILTETKEREEKKLYRYQVGRYEVKRIVYESGYTTIDIRKKISIPRVARDDYLPDIYAKNNWVNAKFEGFSFEVQTTSYGSLEIDELKKVIAGLQEAMEVAQTLTNEFAKA